MKVSREMLEEQLEEYEEKLKGVKSYIKELNAMTTKHGTEKEHFESDLMEAEHNIKYYEAEMAGIKAEMGGASMAGRVQAGAAALLPNTAKQATGSFILSTISFVAGALLGARLKSRRRSEAEDKAES